ncbi:MAG: serine--tRNA ligase [Acidimicrobiia bacterium]|nr:serine--tRNA ligase [Acidimicrobiia bacterium]
MLDVRLLRTEPDAVRAGVARRGDDTAEVDRAIELDEAVRRIAGERDELRRRVKSISKEVGALRRDDRVSEAEALRSESRELGEQEKQLAAEADELAARLRELFLRIANLPADDCPDGADADHNVVTRVEGGPALFADHQRVPHWEVGEALGILDVERAVKLSGSMFVMYRGAGATLVRALCQLALDRNADLYEEIRPPTLVLTDTMVSTGHLPKFEEDAYHVERDDLWAIPTAEVSLTSLGRDEILDESDLPARMMAHTSCFRREAGSAGRDTRGLLRVHEFDKVELLAYATADQAPDLHAEIVGRAESLLADLGLTYRVLDLCAGDLGVSAKRTFDLEAYAPGADQWLEVSSISWFGDYQARRANVRYRPADGDGTRFVHTLNGSGLGRCPGCGPVVVETHRRRRLRRCSPTCSGRTCAARTSSDPDDRRRRADDRALESAAAGLARGAARGRPRACGWCARAGASSRDTGRPGGPRRPGGRCGEAAGASPRQRGGGGASSFTGLEGAPAHRVGCGATFPRLVRWSRVAVVSPHGGDVTGGRGARAAPSRSTEGWLG